MPPSAFLLQFEWVCILNAIDLHYAGNVVVWVGKATLRRFRTVGICPALRQHSRFLDSVGWFASSPSCSTRTDSSKKSLITGRSSVRQFPYRHETPIYFEVRLSLHPRQYNPRCGQRLEGVASGYWTVSAKHRVASSAIRVRVPRPPRSLDNYRFCLTG